MRKDRTQVFLCKRATDMCT